MQEFNVEFVSIFKTDRFGKQVTVRLDNCQVKDFLNLALMLSNPYVFNCLITVVPKL